MVRPASICSLIVSAVDGKRSSTARCTASTVIAPGKLLSQSRPSIPAVCARSNVSTMAAFSCASAELTSQACDRNAMTDTKRMWADFIEVAPIPTRLRAYTLERVASRIAAVGSNMAWAW